MLLLYASSAGALASLRLITFDLDDTLWPTGPVVRAANAKLALALGADEVDLQARLKDARSAGGPKPSYSEARIIAVESFLLERDPSGSRRAEAEGFFEMWLGGGDPPPREPSRDGARARRRLRKRAARERKVAVVGEPDGLVVVGGGAAAIGHAHHAHDRAEDLRLQDVGALRHVDDHCRGVEGARRERVVAGGRVPSDQQPRALGHRVVDERLVVPHLPPAHGDCPAVDLCVVERRAALEA
mmetsp:Transcript_34195/g.110230  ORF Transcript_34195/g.110230 Transcript_34195/m.110230 type:complete len:243 (+) Transcript_34195:149-877(+)